MNPLNFTKMERWSTKNPDGLGSICVGFTNEEVYLTFDIRKTGSTPLPVFSPQCKIGLNHKKEDYDIFRELFQTLDGYSITELTECEYIILNIHKKYKFKA